ncbi:MAG: sulfatase-like hydrolase/transferase [Bacteroidales bacterium]|nr:sulfatase-like hydrolase/transferase [Bacteroidales bacterium]
MRKLQLYFYFTLPLLSVFSCSCQKPVEQPNFVVFFIDDMGYGDIGPFGSKLNKTPNLDRMADEGLKLTSFYVASVQCTPSRAALLTGCYANRVGMDGKVCKPEKTKALNPKEYTMAEMFKDAGYTTGCFGKWHLGHLPGYLPSSHGFDVYHGIPYSNDMWIQLDSKNNWKRAKYNRSPMPWIINETPVAVVKDGVDQSLLTQATTHAALDFIKEQGEKEEPFFAYIPYAAVHMPRFGHSDFLPKGYTGNDIQVHLTAQVEELDWAVGEVMNTLEELGIEENTMVLFFSDNGGSKGTDMGVLSGSKYQSANEGGQRSAFLSWWPKKIPAGVTSDEIAISIDLLPTFAKLAGGHLSDNKIDGRDISEFLFNPEQIKSPQNEVANRGRAYRMGKWKLIGNRLYNLEEDIAETTNVANQFPEIYEEIKRKNEDWIKEMEEGLRPHAQMENLAPVITCAEADELPKLSDWFED